MKPTTQLANQPLGGSSGDWRHRLLHFHLPLALTSALIMGVWMSLPLFLSAGHQPPQTGVQTTGHQPSPQRGDHGDGHQLPQATATDHQSPQPGEPRADQQSPAQDERQTRVRIGRFTTATGYVALGLLAFTLLIGPANLMLRRRNPVSSYLRRDAGTWTAIMSVIHVVAGFFVHGPPAPLGERILSYFMAPDGSLLTNTFALGNWTGLLATVIVVGLLAISSDFALRKLKARPWKWLQRLNYAVFVLVILHAIYYGALVRITSPSTILLGLSVSGVVIGQALGIRLWRRRNGRTHHSQHPPQAADAAE